MPSDTVLCAAEIAPGKACRAHVLSTSARVEDGKWVKWCIPHSVTAPHRFIPGRQCRTCGGSGEMLSADFDGEPIIKCPRCIGGN